MQILKERIPFTPHVAEVRLSDFPKKFWVVTKPDLDSDLDDCCFQVSILGFMRQVRGGLDEDDIYGFYFGAIQAKKDARKLLAEAKEN